MPHHDVLQWGMISCRSVLSPLSPVSVNIPQEKFLDLPSMAVVLRLHPDQLHLQHGETQRHQTPPPRPRVVQLVQLSRHHSTQSCTDAGRGQPGGQPLLGCEAVDYNAHLTQVVFSFCGSLCDPGGLT